MSHVNLQVDYKQQIKILNTFSRCMGQEAHIISRHPYLVWQQFYNRLQWGDEEIKKILNEALEKRVENSGQPWLHNVRRIKEAPNYIRLFVGHINTVNAVEFSPDGKILASVSSDNTLRIWESNTGIQKQVFEHPASVVSCAFSKDGRFLVTVCSDKILRLWLVHDYQKNVLFEGHTNSINDIAFSPDGLTLATASDDKTLRLWDVETGREKQAIRHPDNLTSCAFAPNGTVLASACRDRKVRFWDPSTGKEVSKCEGYTNTKIRYSPDGNYLALVGFNHIPHVLVGTGKTLRLLDIRNGQKNIDLEHPDRVHSCTFSPDGKFLASTYSNSAVVWDLELGKIQIELSGHSSQVEDCAFSPDGLTLVTASSDRSIRMWDLDLSYAKSTVIQHDYKVNDCAFSPDGQTIASVSEDDTVRIWEGSTGRNLAVLEGHTHIVQTCCFSPDGQLLASAGWDNNIILWKTQKFLKDNILKGHTDRISCCAFSPQGDFLASSSIDATLRLWDLKTKKLYGIIVGKPENGNISTFFSHNQKNNTNPNLWKAINESSWALAKGGLIRVNHLCFSPDGTQIAVACDDHTIRLWDFRNGNELAILNGHTSEVKYCTFSPDGNTLASIGKSETTIRFWNINTAKERARLEMYSKVNCCSFSPDNSLLLITGDSGEAQIWNIAQERLICNFILSGQSDTCSFSPAGRTLATGDQIGNFYVLKLKGSKTEPIYITPINLRNQLAIQCPVCLQYYPIEQYDLGKVMNCKSPSCSTQLHINPFSISPVDPKQFQRLIAHKGK